MSLGPSPPRPQQVPTQPTRVQQLHPRKVFIAPSHVEDTQPASLDSVDDLALREQQARVEVLVRAAE